MSAVSSTIRAQDSVHSEKSALNDLVTQSKLQAARYDTDSEGHADGLKWPPLNRVFHFVERVFSSIATRPDRLVC